MWRIKYQFHGWNCFSGLNSGKFIYILVSKLKCMHWLLSGTGSLFLLSFWNGPYCLPGQHYCRVGVLSMNFLGAEICYNTLFHTPSTMENWLSCRFKPAWPKGNLVNFLLGNCYELLWMVCMNLKTASKCKLSPKVSI